MATRHALRRLLEDLAQEVGAPDPAELASQLQMLFEGAVLGALVDGRPQVARAARASWRRSPWRQASVPGGLPPGAGVR